MKYIRLLLLLLCFVPGTVRAVAGNNSGFMVASQLLAAAKNADIQQVQALVNSGADINFVDATGLSLVCTALMNNDVRAAQILQMYGADASKCDKQIKQYNQKNKPKSSGGLFSGLSSTHGLTLAAAGAAVVVGGLFLLTDVFDPGNNNDSSASGTRPGGNGGGSSSGTGTVAFTLPYGPAMPNAASETANYSDNLDLYSSSEVASIKDSFDLMTDAYQQNYLLMMHGYSPLARGYLGMSTLRNRDSKAPVSLDGFTAGRDSVLGGMPINVALVTANGVNATAESSLGDTILPWTTLKDGVTPNGGSVSMISSKYYNNKIISGDITNSLEGYYTEENSDTITTFDLAGFGTVVNNINAEKSDNLLAKVVGGRITSDSGFSDYMGFMPNGQMTIFRTGNGTGMIQLDAPVNSGSYVRTGDSFSTGDVLNLFDKNLVIEKTGNNVNAIVSEKISLSGTPSNGDTYTLSNNESLRVTDVDNNKIEGYTGSGEESVTYYGYFDSNNLYVFQKDTTDIYYGYFGVSGDNLIYISDTIGGNVNQAYAVGSDGSLMLTKQSGDIDYQNYLALYKAAGLWQIGDNSSTGRSKPEILANASVIEPLHLVNVATVNDMLALEATEAGFINYVNMYYNRNETDGQGGTDNKPGSSAYSFFGGLGSAWYPLVVFSTGAVQTDSNYSGQAYFATFENAAPLVFNNLDHLFMSVVAVGLEGNGTSNTGSVSGFSTSNKYKLSQWKTGNETPDDTSDDLYYKSRICGVAGTGVAGSKDPWCFASAGVTDELAVASAAGAAGVLKSAFSYLTNKQIFALLALTADGPYLSKTAIGSSTDSEALETYLKSMFSMPGEYEYQWLQNGKDYLSLFKEVFGYGLINLERATTPGTSVYYYDGTNIVSASGNAYWRAASQTAFRTSSALQLRSATINVPFYDVLESVDGSLSLPRVWQNEFALTSDSRHGLYMGDVLGELKTRADSDNRVQIGNLGFSMKFSERAYNDNLNGLDSLQFDYSHGNWNLVAGYQHYLTDGESRFGATANPILALASSAVISDAEYRAGRWTVGARAFSGSITDEGLLETDPTVSSQFIPAKLGGIQGVQSHIAWYGDKVGFVTSVGRVHESDTVLGTFTDGLLDLGGGKTTYLDAVVRISPVNDVQLKLRGTVAHTTSNVSGDFILGLSDMYSNAVSVGLDWKNISLSVAQPLSVTHGALRYAYAEYDVVDGENGNYVLDAHNLGIKDVSLQPEHRELRFMGAWRHNFGAFTDGALGFVYRVNPNNTDDFGNESVFMIKVHHRLGI